MVRLLRCSQIPWRDSAHLRPGAAAFDDLLPLASHVPSPLPERCIQVHVAGSSPGGSQTKTAPPSPASGGFLCVRLYICISSQMSHKISAFITPFAETEAEAGKLSSCSGSQS